MIRLGLPYNLQYGDFFYYCVQVKSSAAVHFITVWTFRNIDMSEEYDPSNVDTEEVSQMLYVVSTLVKSLAPQATQYINKSQSKFSRT